MPVSVETLGGLKRRVTVSVPTEKLEEELELRLRNYARKVKIDGFRPGKVPFHVVKNRYSDSLRAEVARDLVQPTLADALKEQDLVPAGYPAIEPQQLETGKDFVYTAEFEIFPEIEIKELNKDKIEAVKSKVTEADVDQMIEKLRGQAKEWQEVSRAAPKQGDKVIIDFEGFVDEKLFAGGKAESYEVEIGSGAMIPGFEEGLLKGKTDKPFEISVTFPKDYNHKELAGKDAIFKITIHSILESSLPNLDDDFAATFNIQEGGVEALKKDIKENMERELEKRLSSLNREKIFDALMQANAIELPESMIEQEIGHLKHEMFHRIFGPKHSDNEKIPDFPRSLFEEQAKRRVHLGLLFSEYVKKHELSASKERVTAMIEKMANAYEKPEELRDWYQSNPERMGDIEALVMEELVAEKISEHATMVDKKKSYDEIMNPAKEKDAKGE